MLILNTLLYIHPHTTTLPDINVLPKGTLEVYVEVISPFWATTGSAYMELYPPWCPTKCRTQNCILHFFFFFFECDQENNVPLCTVICLPLSPFLSPSFIFPFHPSLNPIRLGTWAAELCLHRLQLDTHTHRQTIICIHACTHMTTHTLSTLHTLPPINFLLSFVWIKTLKSAYKRWPWDTED